MKMSVFGLLAAAGLAAQASATITIVPSAVPFTDISATGTSPGSSSDDAEFTITGAQLNTAGFLGNTLLAGGVSIRVGNNGGVIWGNAVADAFTGATEIGYYNAGPNNSTTPAGSQTSIATMVGANTGQSGNGAGIRQFIMPLWDDYTPPTGQGANVLDWQVIAGDLYIQWTNQDAFAATGSGVVTFQMIVRSNPAAGASLIDFVYQDTQFAASQYQNDGGSATIGFKNNGLAAIGNDVEYGIGGGGTSATADPAFNGLGMQPKVAGYLAADNANLPHSLSIVPAPGSLALLGLGGLVAGRRRR